MTLGVISEKSRARAMWSRPIWLAREIAAMSFVVRTNAGSK
jgi:hypothetical protein